MTTYIPDKAINIFTYLGRLGNTKTDTKSFGANKSLKPFVGIWFFRNHSTFIKKKNTAATGFFEVSKKKYLKIEVLNKMRADYRILKRCLCKRKKLLALTKNITGSALMYVHSRNIMFFTSN